MSSGEDVVGEDEPVVDEPDQGEEIEIVDEETPLAANPINTAGFAAIGVVVFVAIALLAIMVGKKLATASKERSAK